MWDDLQEMDPGKAKLIKRIGYIVALIVAVIAAVVLVTNVAGALSGKAEKESLIAQKQAELAEFDKPENKPAPLPELTNAFTAGNSLAQAQTKYRDIYREDTRAMSANKAECQKYLSDTDYMAASEPWFDTEPMKVGNSRNQVHDYNWTFCTTYGSLEADIPVFWVCTGKSQDRGTLVLSYVTGIYHGESGQFSDIQVYDTWEGAYVGTPYETVDPAPAPSPSEDPAATASPGQGGTEDGNESGEGGLTVDPSDDPKQGNAAGFIVTTPNQNPKAEDEFRVHVSLTGGATFARLQFGLAYNSEAMEVKNIELSRDLLDDMTTTNPNNDGAVTIGVLSSRGLAASMDIATITFKAKTDLTGFDFMIQDVDFDDRDNVPIEFTVIGAKDARDYR